MRRMLSEKELIVKMDHVPLKWEPGMPNDICVDGTVYTKTLDLFTLEGTHWQYDGEADLQVAIRSGGMLEIDWWDLQTLAGDGRKYQYFVCYPNTKNVYLAGSGVDEDGNDIIYWIIKEGELIQTANFTILEDPRNYQYDGEPVNYYDNRLATILCGISTKIQQWIDIPQYYYSTTNPLAKAPRPSTVKADESRYNFAPLKLRYVSGLITDNPQTAIYRILNENILWRGYNAYISFNSFCKVEDKRFYEDESELIFSTLSLTGGISNSQGPQDLHIAMTPLDKPSHNDAPIDYFEIITSSYPGYGRYITATVDTATNKVVFDNDYYEFPKNYCFPDSESQWFTQRTVSIYSTEYAQEISDNWHQTTNIRSGTYN